MSKPSFSALAASALTGIENNLAAEIEEFHDGHHRVHSDTNGSSYSQAVQQAIDHEARVLEAEIVDLGCRDFLTTFAVTSSRLWRRSFNLKVKRARRTPEEDFDALEQDDADERTHVLYRGS
ncbi:MAG: hypothetical protein AAF657_24490 [Acidobacteriota bacterium]